MNRQIFPQNPKINATTTTPLIFKRPVNREGHISGRDKKSSNRKKKVQFAVRVTRHFMLKEDWKTEVGRITTSWQQTKHAKLQFDLLQALRKAF